MKKYRLIVNDHDLIPDIAKEYFLKGIDGYSYLLVDRESPVEFWKYCYGDSHTWKEYAAHDHFIARIGRREAANILRSVRSWNREFKRRQQIKNAAEEAKRVQFCRLPSRISMSKAEIIPSIAWTGKNMQSCSRPAPKSALSLS